VTREELVAYCLAKPDATEDHPWGEQTLTAKVGGKVFAFIGLHGGGLGVKCGRDTEESAELRLRYPDDVTVMAYIGRYGWNSVRLGGAVPGDELRELVDDSYDQVVARLPRAKRPGRSTGPPHAPVARGRGA
jgi:predicted DNA-binding protein (MmcQ/YjbR family)